ncbi:hypothetical protein RR48_13663 [Papilio machaon]|uniref:Pupal cuticle protein C1B n=1 Tax=Papilio machaon TaxID=76193 RepID=A0A194RGU4_PAPMA|nr:hypothetical protein RR48_13663 [Papilio machaon]
MAIGSGGENTSEFFFNIVISTFFTFLSKIPEHRPHHLLSNLRLTLLGREVFIFACFLALAAAKPGVLPVAYTAPVAAAYTAPVAAAYTAPLAYSAYTAPVAAYSAYTYASPYAAYYLR